MTVQDKLSYRITDPSASYAKELFLRIECSLDNRLVDLPKCYLNFLKFLVV